MNTFFLTFLSASMGALSNLFFRKNSSADKNTSVNGYLLLFYACSFVFSLLANPDIFKIEINYVILGIGACVGMLNIYLMRLTSQAIRKGPSNLTFAFQNASSIFPGLLLFLSFGKEFGFTYSLSQFAGVVLLLLGLFVGALKESKASLSWLKYALAGFIVQIAALTLIQMRCILFDCGDGYFFSNLASSEADAWFLPGQFGISVLLQGLIFLQEKRGLKSHELLYGSLAGFANLLASVFIVLATKWALPIEKGMIFPSTAVATIILCNLWASILYKEKFNFLSNALCSCGVFVAVLA